MPNKDITLKQLIEQVVVLDLALSRIDRAIGKSTFKGTTKRLLTERNETANRIDDVLRKAIKRNSELR